MHPHQSLNLKFDLKALNKREFEGHGSTFGNVDLGGDVVMPGAFTRTLAEHRAAGSLPQQFWMHQPDKVPGKWLDMREDSTGLYVKGILADTELGNEMQALLGMKAVRGLSIGFRTRDADYADDGTRLIKDIDLWEVSLVSLAMNPQAQITSSKARLSQFGEYVPDPRELERKLRDVGFSQLNAKRVISAMRALTDDDLGIRDVDRTRDVDVDESESDLVKSLEALSGSMLSGAFHRKN